MNGSVGWPDETSVWGVDLGNSLVGCCVGFVGAVNPIVGSEQCVCSHLVKDYLPLSSQL